MASIVGICNAALTELGAETIVDLYPAAGEEATAEQKACQAHYEPARDFVLDDADWGFALARRQLPQSAEALAWGRGNKFLLPSDLIRIVRASATAEDYNEVEWVREGQFIIAETDAIFLTYVMKVEDANRFTPGFTTCLIAYLASVMAIPLAESRTLRNENYDLYNLKLRKARANDGLGNKMQEVRTTRLRRSRWGRGRLSMPLGEAEL